MGRLVAFASCLLGAAAALGAAATPDIFLGDSLRQLGLAPLARAAGDAPLAERHGAKGLPTFVAEPNKDYLLIEGVKVYLDEKSVPLVNGSSVDYVDSLMGAGFTVENPNSVGGCGCGSSFRTAESAGAPSACSH